MDDLSVLNRDDRDEPIVIGCATRKNLAVHVVLKDHDATVLTAVHNKRVAGVQLDRLAVSREVRHQRRLTWASKSSLSVLLVFAYVTGRARCEAFREQRFEIPIVRA